MEMEGNEPRDTQATTYDTEPRTTDKRSGGGSLIDVQYFISPPCGILKCVEIILGVIAAGCASSAWFPALHFFLFVSVTALLCTLILLCLYLFRVPAMTSNIPWNLIEFIYNCVVTGFYLIASIVLISIGNAVARYIAASVFGFFNTIAYGIGIYFSYISWRSTSTTHSVTVTA
ncbi:CKLF-like MARVEL transmembrane domain-containing protein 4 [Tubulanus polymorphus]|uniref:CKLF-like MARVEL transmembrane domain-containing protein 4 n=1 Tax=Tubulanus polymorphus TaxID=672921 RepID=UPI003DA2AEFC